jgi:hypothetical protein
VQRPSIRTGVSNVLCFQDVIGVCTSLQASGLIEDKNACDIHGQAAKTCKRIEKKDVEWINPRRKRVHIENWRLRMNTQRKSSLSLVGSVAIVAFACASFSLGVSAASDNGTLTVGQSGVGCPTGGHLYCSWLLTSYTRVL